MTLGSGHVCRTKTARIWRWSWKRISQKPVLLTSSFFSKKSPGLPRVACQFQTYLIFGQKLTKNRNLLRINSKSPLIDWWPQRKGWRKKFRRSELCKIRNSPLSRKPGRAQPISENSRKKRTGSWAERRAVKAAQVVSQPKLGPTTCPCKDYTLKLDSSTARIPQTHSQAWVFSTSSTTRDCSRFPGANCPTEIPNRSAIWRMNRRKYYTHFRLIFTTRACQEWEVVTRKKLKWECRSGSHDATTSWIGSRMKQKAKKKRSVPFSPKLHPLLWRSFPLSPKNFPNSNCRVSNCIWICWEKGWKKRERRYQSWRTRVVGRSGRIKSPSRNPSNLCKGMRKNINFQVRPARRGSSRATARPPPSHLRKTEINGMKLPAKNCTRSLFSQTSEWEREKMWLLLSMLLERAVNKDEIHIRILTFLDILILKPGRANTRTNSLLFVLRGGGAHPLALKMLKLESHSFAFRIVHNNFVCSYIQ